MSFYLSLEHLDAKRAGDLSTLFDVGGIFGKFYILLFHPLSDQFRKSCGLHSLHILLVLVPDVH